MNKLDVFHLVVAIFSFVVAFVHVALRIHLFLRNEMLVRFWDFLWSFLLFYFLKVLWFFQEGFWFFCRDFEQLDGEFDRAVCFDRTTGGVLALLFFRFSLWNKLFLNFQRSRFLFSKKSIYVLLLCLLFPVTTVLSSHLLNFPVVEIIFLGLFVPKFYPLISWVELRSLNICLHGVHRSNILLLG